MPSSFCPPAHENGTRRHWGWAALRLTALVVPSLLLAPTLGCGPSHPEGAITLQQVPQKVRDAAARALPGVRITQANYKDLGPLFGGVYTLAGQDDKGKARGAAFTREGALEKYTTPVPTSYRPEVVEAARKHLVEPTFDGEMTQVPSVYLFGPPAGWELKGEDRFGNPFNVQVSNEGRLMGGHNVPVPLGTVPEWIRTEADTMSAGTEWQDAWVTNFDKGPVSTSLLAVKDYYVLRGTDTKGSVERVMVEVANQLPIARVPVWVIAEAEAKAPGVSWEDAWEMHYKPCVFPVFKKKDYYILRGIDAHGDIKQVRVEIPDPPPQPKIAP